MDFDYDAYIENIRRTLPRIDEVCPGIEPDPVIEAFKPGVDITLLIENLKLTPAQRADKFAAMMKGIYALREAGHRKES